MIYLIRLLKAAKAYRKAFNAWDNDPENHAIWNDLEDKEHELLGVAVDKGRKNQ